MSNILLGASIPTVEDIHTEWRKARKNPVGFEWNWSYR